MRFKQCRTVRHVFFFFINSSFVCISKACEIEALENENVLTPVYYSPVIRTTYRAIMKCSHVHLGFIPVPREENSNTYTFIFNFSLAFLATLNNDCPTCNDFSPKRKIWNSTAAFVNQFGERGRNLSVRRKETRGKNITKAWSKKRKRKPCTQVARKKRKQLTVSLPWRLLRVEQYFISRCSTFLFYFRFSSCFQLLHARRLFSKSAEMTKCIVVTYSGKK